MGVTAFCVSPDGGNWINSVCLNAIILKYLFLLLPLFGFTQQTNSYLIHPLLEGFKAELIIRGIDPSPLERLDSVNLVHKEGYFETYLETFKNGRQYLQLNDIKTEHEFERVWRLHHELGHVFGLRDCYKCKYHFMAANFSKRGAFLLKDPYLRMHFFELYFSEIKTKIHTHL